MSDYRCTNGSLALLGTTALAALLGCSSSQPLTKTTEQSRTVPVRTVAVQQTEIPRTTTQPATVHAYFRAELRAKAEGYVKELKADIGDYVKAGAELALIEMPEMEKRRQMLAARVRRLEAEVRRSQVGIDLAAAHIQSSMAKLAEAKSQKDRADAALAAAEAEFNRTQDLVQRQSLQNRMLDEVRKKRDSTLAETAAVGSAIDSAQAEVSVAQAQQAVAEADLEVAQADAEIARHELEEIDVMISYATVRAPFAGLITQRNVEPGNLVGQADRSRDMPPLFVISQVDRVRVRIPIPETAVPHVNAGDSVTLTFPSFEREAPMTAVVTRRSGSLDPHTRTMLIEAELDNAEGKLLPGMFGQASVESSVKVATQVLPSRAIRFDESGSGYVYLVQQGAIVSIRPVSTGIDNGNSIEIVSGLDPGQRVIDAHLKRFTEGQQVTVLN